MIVVSGLGGLGKVRQTAGGHQKGDQQIATVNCGRKGAYVGMARAETQYAEPQYAETQYAEPQHVETQYAEPQYVEPQYVEPLSPSQAPRAGRRRCRNGGRSRG